MAIKPKNIVSTARQSGRNDDCLLVAGTASIAACNTQTTGAGTDAWRADTLHGYQ